MKTNGPGKYDWLATKVREEIDAQLVVVIVYGGMMGNGFSVQATHPDYIRQLPETLDFVAQNIRAEISESGDGH